MRQVDKHTRLKPDKIIGVKDRQSGSVTVFLEGGAKLSVNATVDDIDRISTESACLCARCKDRSKCNWYNLNGIRALECGHYA